MPAATMARAVHGAMAAVTSAGVLSVTLLPDQILNNGDYKQNVGEGSEKEFEWVRRLLENQQDTEADDYIHSLKVDMFDDEVFVFTPKA